MAENKKKTCWLVTLSVVCILSIVGIIIVSIIMSSLKVDLSNAVKDFIEVFIFGLLAASPLLGILALLKIYRSNNLLAGEGCAIAVIVASSIALGFIAPTFSFMGGYIQIMLCNSNMRVLSSDITTYAENHNDSLPEPSKWCDLLITDTNASPKQFICRSSDAKYGESSYALNKNVISMKFSEIPKDMVLLFEAKYDNRKSQRDFPLKSRLFTSHLSERDIQKHQSDYVYQFRWNQVGGPELLAVNNHESQGCNILFADGSIEFVQLSKLPELKWKIEGKADFPAYLLEVNKNKDVIKKVSVIFIGLIVFVSVVFILCRYLHKKYLLFIVLIGLISAGVGCFFGLLAEMLYRVKDFHGIGIIAGGIVGLAVGICYTAILANTDSWLKQQKSFKGYAVSLGMAAGVICSTIVHLVLMIMHEEKKLFGMAAGLPFGIIAGAILGAICFGIVKKYYTEDAQFISHNAAKEGGA